VRSAIKSETAAGEPETERKIGVVRPDCGADGREERERVTPERRGGFSLLRVIARRWGAPHRPPLLGIVWVGGMLSLLVWLSGLHLGLFLIPPFVATMTIVLCLPDATVAQPFAVIAGSTLGTLIGTAAVAALGPGPQTAALAAVAALMILPLLHAYHPPGVALALYPALLHPGLWFALKVVLPFTFTVVSSASLLSRWVSSWPAYPLPLHPDQE
jgi:CBS-domain-containing membrane protein